MPTGIVSVVANYRFASALHRARVFSRTKCAVAACLLACLGVLQMAAQAPAKPDRPGLQPDSATKAALAREYGRLPLSFEANRGQTDPGVRFMSRGNGYSLFLTDSAAVLSLRKPETPPASNPAATSRVMRQQPAAFKTDVVRMELSGASRSLRVTGDSQLPGTANYFIGNDPAKWHSAVPTYARVKYAHVYPGVDLVYYGNQSQLEYDFVVAPNADPKPIKLHFAGASKLKLNANGDLEVIAKNGQIAFHKPVVYQEIAGRRNEVEGRFSLLAKNTVAFVLGNYDHGKEVVIDPTLSYSTYLGGSTSGSYGTSIAIGTDGAAYITGITFATDFPTTSGAYSTAKSLSIPFLSFITKLNPSGSGLVYSAYLGGSGNSLDNGAIYGDYPSSVAIDATGDAYVDGIAYSTDFPTTAGAFQTVNKGSANGTPNGFITKFNATGTGLVYSTYLGGSGLSGFTALGQFSLVGTNEPGGDGCAHLALDSSGNAYLTGEAFSTDFPTTNGAFQTVNHAAAIHVANAFIAKLNPSGSSLVYSTYLGGSHGDGGGSIAVDAQLNSYVVGATYSADFPVTAGAIQPQNNAASNGLTNGFITKLNATGTALIYSTYLGGSGNVAVAGGDAALNIALDSTASAYVSGGASSDDFPVTAGAFQTSNRAFSSNSAPNLFITKVNPSGSSLIYSTYLGSSRGEVVGGSTGIAVDADGDAYVTGSTLGSDFPMTADAFQSQNKCSAHNLSNVFLAELKPSGDALAYATYFGGNGFPIALAGGGTAYLCDLGFGVALDSTDNIYLTGNAYSPDFPVTTGAFQTTKTVASDAYIAKFATGTAEAAAGITNVSGAGQTAAYGSTFSNALVVLVKDAGGNPVSGATVTFAGTGLSFSSSTATTGSNGEASVMATATASGTLTATASVSGVSTPATFTFTGTKVALTVTATNASVAYGQPIPALTYSVSGFVNGDTQGVLSGAPSETTTATNGATPGPYPISISQGTLMATNYTFPSSNLISGTLTITSLGTVATPTFSIATGTYSSVQTVTIADTTSGATIYYTTNGTTPTTSSTKYTGPITVSSSETLEALAVASGYTDSPVASAIYTINIPTPTLGVVSGSGQSAAYGSAFAAPLVVSIKDSSNNPVSGVVVTFSGTGVKLSANSATTGSNGQASVAATAIASGSLTVSATASGATGTVSFTLTATQVALTVTANSVSVAYGQPIPALTYAITGFVNGDTSSVVTGAPTETTTATQTSLVGTYPITIAAGTLAASNYTFPTPNFVNGTLTVTSAGTASTPTFTPAAGTYTSAQSVTISDTTPGAVIYCTTDGSTPTTSSTKCTTPISVGVTETIKAIATATGYTTSAVASAAYTINIPQVATPAFSPAGGTYTSVQTVTIADSTVGAAIHYTTDGSAPTAASATYTAPLTVSSTETIQAIAIAAGDTNSTIASATYTISLPAATFTLAASPATATVTAGQSATYTITATPQNNFVQTVTFACPGLAASLQCRFAPATVTPAGAAVKSTLTVSTTTASAAAQPLHSLPWKAAGGIIAMSLLLWPLRRRRLQLALLLAMFLFAGTALIGCGSSPSTTTAPQSQSYTVSITATGGGVSQSSTVSLTVTN